MNSAVQSNSFTSFPRSAWERTVETLRVSRSPRALHPLRVLCGYSLCLLLLLSTGCATYQIGNASLYPTGIKTIYVPIFKSTSFRRNMGEQLTEAVVKEIQKRTPYKVVSDPTADSVLSGCITNESKSVLVSVLSGDAREVQAAVTVQVSWVDRKGRMLRDNKSIPLPSEIAEVTATGDIVAEVGQSLTTAQQEALGRLAKQIVDMMETPW